MSGVLCAFCGWGEAARAEEAVRIVGDSQRAIDADLCDMELDDGGLSVSIVDGDAQYVAVFPANYCPCCGRRL